MNSLGIEPMTFMLVYSGWTPEWEEEQNLMTHIYIYGFGRSDAFNQSNLHCIQVVIFFQLMNSLGIEPMTFMLEYSGLTPGWEQDQNLMSFFYI